MSDYEIRELSFRDHPYKIACTTKMAQDPSWFSFDDESSVRDRDWHIEPGQVVFDIGSAYGSYALTALASGASRVFCFNPNSNENDVLGESLQANGWTGKCEAYEGGLWSVSGWLRDIDQHFVDGREQLDDKERLALRDHFDVRKLDDIAAHTTDIDNLERLDWIKMDVEGAEVEVLKGAKRTIERFKPRILIELHLFKDGTLGTQTTELLESYGYRKVSEHSYHSVAHALYEPRSV